MKNKSPTCGDTMFWGTIINSLTSATVSGVVQRNPFISSGLKVRLLVRLTIINESDGSVVVAVAATV